MSAAEGRWRRTADGGRMAYEAPPRILERRANGLTIKFFAPRDASGAVQSRPRARAARPAPSRVRGSRRATATSRAPDDDSGPSSDPDDIAAVAAPTKEGGSGE